MIIQQHIPFVCCLFIVVNIFSSLSFVFCCSFFSICPWNNNRYNLVLMLVLSMMMIMILLLHFQYCFALLILWRMLIVFAARSSLTTIICTLQAVYCRSANETTSCGTYLLFYSVQLCRDFFSIPPALIQCIKMHRYKTVFTFFFFFEKIFILLHAGTSCLFVVSFFTYRRIKIWNKWAHKKIEFHMQFHYYFYFAKMNRQQKIVLFFFLL